MPFKTKFERFVETISENETQRVIDMIFQRPELIDSANNGNSNSSFLRIKYLHQCLVYFVFEQMERQVCIWHARIRTQIQTLFLHCSWEEPIPTGRPSWSNASGQRRPIFKFNHTFATFDTKLQHQKCFHVKGKSGNLVIVVPLWLACSKKHDVKVILTLLTHQFTDDCIWRKNNFGRTPLAKWKASCFLSHHHHPSFAIIATSVFYSSMHIAQEFSKPLLRVMKPNVSSKSSNLTATKVS